MSTLIKSVDLPVDFIMGMWAPGPQYHMLRTWTNVMSHLRDEGELHLLAAEVLRHGVHDPVVLGGDGRVWDGTRRIVAAYMKGVLTVPASFGFC